MGGNIHDIRRMTKYRHDDSGLPQHFISKCAGFTLLELLIALTVFAVMSAMAYGGLSSVMRARQGVDEKADRLAKVQTALMIISRDIEQTVNRTIRDQYGDEQKVMASLDYGDNKLEFTRTGWNNPFPNKKRVRSMLQRVAYSLKDEKLKRIYWFDLDRSYDSQPFETVLLDHVKAFDLRFVDQKLEWQTKWPADLSPAPLPRAIEVTIDIDQLGRITQLYPVAAGL